MIILQSRKLWPMGLLQGIARCVFKPIPKKSQSASTLAAWCQNYCFRRQDLSPGLLRDRRKCWPLYYSGIEMQDCLHHITSNYYVFSYCAHSFSKAHVFNVWLALDRPGRRQYEKWRTHLIWSSYTLPNAGNAFSSAFEGERKYINNCISRESNPGHIDGNDVFYH